MTKKILNNYKYKKENYNFWVDRLKKQKENLVCTKDINLDKLEDVETELF